MTIKVLVVDDSGFFRRRVAEMINADAELEVIGFANNGREAIENTKKLKPDVITMDIEMPEMNGIEAVRQIMSFQPTPIVMFSSLTTDGAQATLDALDAGAVDFLPKRFQDIAKDLDEARILLCDRIKQVGRKPVRAPRPAPAISTRPAAPRTPTMQRPVAGKPVVPSGEVPTTRNGALKLVAIGTSTGGPVALQNVLSKIPENFPAPIIIVQHMPGTFTPTFAQRLDQLCAIRVKEAQDGDVLQAGVAYLAPGGMQMLLDKKGVLHVHESDPSETYKPSVDLTFRSIAEHFPNKTLAIVMTGMGADGRNGSELLKQAGAVVWAQDEQSCVVYGMPAAIVDAGLADEVLSLDDIGSHIVARF